MTDQVEEQIRRLQRHLDRERRARLEAERIAEESTRGLYERQQQLLLAEAVAVASNQASSVDEALKIALLRVCEFTHWPVGHAYLLDEASAMLVSSKVWHLEDPGRFESFRQVTERTRLPPGVGLPGRVLSEGKPAWIRDVTVDPNFPRARPAAEIGIRAGFAFPVFVGPDVAAVLEFFSQRPQEPNQALLTIMAHVGTQLGRVLERKRADEALRASEAVTRSVIDHMLEGLVIADEKGLIESANPAALRIFGYQADELVGRSLALLLPPSAAADTQRALDEMRENGIGRITEREGRRKNGNLFPFVLSLFEFTTSEGRHFAGSVRDLSEQREVERLKREFVATVSHELRTPLTSIRGSLSLLTGGALGELPPEARELLEIAERNARRLVTLINDILDLERLEAGRIEFHLRPIPLASVLERSVEAVRAMAEQRGIALVAAQAAPVTVLADADRLVQVLVNLLSNAIKFSPIGNPVTVSSRETPGWVEVRVDDRGRGVPAAHRELIFQRFHQVDASDARKEGGTGLGLAICKAIVEQHGGTIGVESEEGRGSTFLFRVPAVAGAVEARGTAVLLYSGKADVQRQLGGLLARQGYDVTTPASAAEARDLLSKGGVSVLVLESALPGHPGREVLEGIRRDPGLASLPLIIVGEGVLLSPDELSEKLAVVLRQTLTGDQLLEAIRGSVAGGGRADVLLVEDDEPLLGVMTRHLLREGIAVRTATTAREALRLAREAAPALLVLDIGLPDADGFDVVEGLRAHPGLSETALLVYTGRELTGEQRGRLRLGPTRFLTKSKASDEEFVLLVRDLLGRAPTRPA